MIKTMLESGRIRNPRLQGDHPRFRSKIGLEQLTIRSEYYEKFASKNTPSLPELKAKLKNRPESKRKNIGRSKRRTIFPLSLDHLVNMTHTV